MRNHIHLLLCLLLLSCGQSQETKNNHSFEEKRTIADTAVNNPASISEIKQVYAATISKLEGGLLDSVSIRYDCNSERIGTITYFTADGKLRMIKHDYHEYDHYSATDQYFVSNSNLFFVHHTSISWSFVSEEDAVEGATQDKFTEQRMYVVNKSPILCLEKKYAIRSDRPSEVDGDNATNYEVECQSIQPTLKDFSKLMIFKDRPDQDCLEK